MKYDPFDNPEWNTAALRNLVKNFRRLGLMPALQEMTFDEVVEAWWQAQAMKADEVERQKARIADPNSRVGKKT